VVEIRIRDYVWFNRPIGIQWPEQSQGLGTTHCIRTRVIRVSHRLML